MTKSVTGVLCAMILALALSGEVHGVEIFPGDSFEAAVEALQAGDTLTIHEGAYSDSGRVSITVRGTAEKPVLITGAPRGARPHITRPAGVAAQNTINIEGASFLTIRGLEITGNGGDGIRITGRAHNVAIEDNRIHSVSVGVNLRNSMQHIVVKGNEIFDTFGTGEGVYVGCHDGTCAVTESRFEGNWVHHTGGSQGDGIEIKYGSYGNVVRDNVVHNTKQPCILVYGVPDAFVERPNIVEANVVWDCPQSIDVIADTIVRNNVVVGSLVTQNHAAVRTMRNVSIINNTVVGSMRFGGWGVNSLSETLVLANNALYGSRFPLVPGKATNRGNQAFLRHTPGVFVDHAGGNFWPSKDSPLLGSAVADFVPSEDVTGSRRAAPYDVGAFETDGRNPVLGRLLDAGFKRRAQPRSLDNLSE